MVVIEYDSLRACRTIAMVLDGMGAASTGLEALAFTGLGIPIAAAGTASEAGVDPFIAITKGAYVLLAYGKPFQAFMATIAEIGVVSDALPVCCMSHNSYIGELGYTRRKNPE
ncbi:MAG: hypothetical protein HGA85_07525, partial [Nanoarchaeota archaeon]|nr:hypothetical protein [Nanoarchaeota archaeon]